MEPNDESISDIEAFTPESTTLTDSSLLTDSTPSQSQGQLSPDLFEDADSPRQQISTIGYDNLYQTGTDQPKATCSEIGSGEQSPDRGTSAPINVRLFEDYSSGESREDSGTETNGTEINGTAQEINGIAQEINGTAQEINGTAQEINGTAQEINGTAQEINGTAQEINGTAQEINGTAQEINGTAQEINGTAQEINGTAQEINGTAQEINGTTQEINGTAQEINGTAQEINGYQSQNGSNNNAGAATTRNSAHASHQSPADDYNSTHINRYHLDRPPINIYQRNYPCDVYNTPMVFSPVVDNRQLQYLQSPFNYSYPTLQMMPQAVRVPQWVNVRPNINGLRGNIRPNIQLRNVRQPLNTWQPLNGTPPVYRRQPVRQPRNVGQSQNRFPRAITPTRPLYTPTVFNVDAPEFTPNRTVTPQQTQESSLPQQTTSGLDAETNVDAPEFTPNRTVTPQQTQESSLPQQTTSGLDAETNVDAPEFTPNRTVTPQQTQESSLPQQTTSGLDAETSNQKNVDEPVNAESYTGSTVESKQSPSSESNKSKGNAGQDFSMVRFTPYKTDEALNDNGKRKSLERKQDSLKLHRILPYRGIVKDVHRYTISSPNYNKIPGARKFKNTDYISTEDSLCTKESPSADSLNSDLDDTSAVSSSFQQIHYTLNIPTENMLNQLNKWGTFFLGLPSLIDKLTQEFEQKALFIIPTENYSEYLKEDYREMEQHIIELFNIPDSITVYDLSRIYTNDKWYIEKCDQHHALLVTISTEQVQKALSVKHDVVLSRSITEASPISTIEACEWDLKAINDLINEQAHGESLDKQERSSEPSKESSTDSSSVIHADPTTETDSEQLEEVQKLKFSEDITLTEKSSLDSSSSTTINVSSDELDLSAFITMGNEKEENNDSINVKLDIVLSTSMTEAVPSTITACIMDLKVITNHINEQAHRESSDKQERCAEPSEGSSTDSSNITHADPTTEMDSEQLEDVQKLTFSEDITLTEPSSLDSSLSSINFSSDELDWSELLPLDDVRDDAIDDLLKMCTFKVKRRPSRGRLHMDNKKEENKDNIKDDAHNSADDLIKMPTFDAERRPSRGTLPMDNKEEENKDNIKDDAHNSADDLIKMPTFDAERRPSRGTLPMDNKEEENKDNIKDDAHNSADDLIKMPTFDAERRPSRGTLPMDNKEEENKDNIKDDAHNSADDLIKMPTFDAERRPSRGTLPMDNKEEENKDNIKDDAHNSADDLIKMPTFDAEMEMSFQKSVSVIASESYYKKDQNKMFANMEHIIELFNIPSAYSIKDLLNIYTEEPRYIKSCDSSRALLITGSAEQANRALLINHDTIKSCCMVEASSLAITTAYESNFAPAVVSIDETKTEEQLITDSFILDCIETTVDETEERQSLSTDNIEGDQEMASASLQDIQPELTPEEQAAIDSWVGGVCYDDWY